MSRILRGTLTLIVLGAYIFFARPLFSLSLEQLSTLMSSGQLGVQFLSLFTQYFSSISMGGSVAVLAVIFSFVLPFDSMSSFWAALGCMLAVMALLFNYAPSDNIYLTILQVGVFILIVLCLLIGEYFISIEYDHEDWNIKRFVLWTGSALILPVLHLLLVNFWVGYFVLFVAFIISLLPVKNLFVAFISLFPVKKENAIIEDEKRKREISRLNDVKHTLELEIAGLEKQQTEKQGRQDEIQQKIKIEEEKLALGEFEAQKYQKIQQGRDEVNGFRKIRGENSIHHPATELDSNLRNIRIGSELTGLKAEFSATQIALADMIKSAEAKQSELDQVKDQLAKVSSNALPQ